MSQQMYGPPQSPYPAASGHATPPPARGGLGIAALILGIVGVCSGLVPILFWLAGILGVVALVLGLSGRGRAKRGQAGNQGMATTGAVLGLASLVLSVVGVVITFQAVDDAVKEINKSVAEAPAAKQDSKEGGGSGDGTGGGATTYGPGDTAGYEGGVEVTVSEPAPYTPDEWAAGHQPGNKAYKVTVRIENTGDEKFDAGLVTVEARTGEEGRNAEDIFDGSVGEGFSGTVLPGKTASTEFAFDTPPGAKTLDVEVSPGWDYDSNQWNLKL